MTILLVLAGAGLTIAVSRYVFHRFDQFISENRKTIGRTHRISE